MHNFSWFAKLKSCVIKKISWKAWFAKFSDNKVCGIYTNTKMERKKKQLVKATFTSWKIPKFMAWSS